MRLSFPDTFFPLDWGMLRRSRRVLIFFNYKGQETPKNIGKLGNFQTFQMFQISILQNLEMDKSTTRSLFVHFQILEILESLESWKVG